MDRINQKIVTLLDGTFWKLRWTARYPDFGLVWVDKWIPSEDRLEDFGTILLGVGDEQIPPGIPAKVISAARKILGTSTRRTGE